MLRRVATVAAVLLALGAGTAAAQGNPPMGGMGQGQGGFAQRRLQALLNGITLTPQQQQKVDSIQQAFRGEMPAFTPGSPPDSATRARMREVRTRQDSTIRAVLTPDQQKTWDQNLANMPQRRPGM